MYLEHFGFTEFPFVLTPNTHYFCNLPRYQEALNILLLSIRSGEGFIKIVGDIGTGKTMLCRALLNNLGEEYVTAYISNPVLDGDGLRRSLAQELGIEFPSDIDQHGLLSLLNSKLLELYSVGKKVIVIVDEAHLISVQNMESLRLLGNLETETTKLLQLVLFGQPELNDRLKKANLRQLAQRITFSYFLQPMNKGEVRIYVDYRLAKAGYKTKELFSYGALNLLFKASKGVPRLINILSHKALMAAFGKGKKIVTKKAMHLAIKDTDSAFPFSRYIPQDIMNTLIIFLLVLLAVELYFLLRVSL